MVITSPLSAGTAGTELASSSGLHNWVLSSHQRRGRRWWRGAGCLLILSKPPGVEGQYPAGCFNWTDSTQISCPSNTIVKHFCLGEGRRTQGQRHSWGLDRDGWRFALECQQKHVVWIELNIWKKNNLLYIYIYISYAYISVSYVYTGSRAGFYVYIYIYDWSFTAIPVDPFSFSCNSWCIKTASPDFARIINTNPLTDS